MVVRGECRIEALTDEGAGIRRASEGRARGTPRRAEAEEGVRRRPQDVGIRSRAVKMLEHEREQDHVRWLRLCLAEQKVRASLRWRVGANAGAPAELGDDRESFFGHVL